MPISPSNKHHHHESPKRKRWLRVGGISVSALFILFCFLIILFPEQYRSLLYRWNLGSDDGVVAAHVRSRYHYDGIDVSHYQGEIDWALVASDTCIQFVYVKATEGSTHVDTFYHRNMSGAKEVGLHVGSYHFLTSTSSVHRQFNHFKAHMSQHPQDLLPMVDVEWAGVKGWSKQQLQDSLAVFLWLVKQHYGRYPLLYADSRFYNAHLSPRFDKLPLFIARYSEEAPIVKGAHRHFIWQRDQYGWVDGINHQVDLNAFAVGTTLVDILLPPTPAGQ